MHFFIPSIVIKVNKNDVEISYDAMYSSDEIDSVFFSIKAIKVKNRKIIPVKIQSRLSKEEYVNNILKIKKSFTVGRYL